MKSGGNSFNYFPRINWPNWQIYCSLNVRLCLVWRIGKGLGLLSTPLQRRGGLPDFPWSWPERPTTNFAPSRSALTERCFLLASRSSRRRASCVPTPQPSTGVTHLAITTSPHLVGPTCCQGGGAGAVGATSLQRQRGQFTIYQSYLSS